MITKDKARVEAEIQIDALENSDAKRRRKNEMPKK